MLTNFVIEKFNEDGNSIPKWSDFSLFDSKVDLVIAETLKPDLKPYILESVKYVTGV